MLKISERFCVLVLHIYMVHILIHFETNSITWAGNDKPIATELAFQLPDEVCTDWD